MKMKDKITKTKFTTNTYMREALYYDIVIVKEEDCFITIKKYNKVKDKFSIKDVTYIDNNYYLLEITPMDEKYNIRFYIDNNKNIIDYYIDITLENGVKYNIPYYIDLYLDIVHYPDTDTVEFYDEDELLDALNNNIISKRDYDMAYSVGNKLIKEINNNCNKYLNMDILKYINNYFN